MNLLAEPTKNIIQTAFDAWNAMEGICWNMLVETPETISNGDVWQKFFDVIQPIFVGVGTFLVIIFFFWGWVKNSTDIHDDMRLEVILRMFIRVVVAEFLVINNFEIMGYFFKAVGALVNLIRPAGSGGEVFTQKELSPAFIQAIDSANFWVGLLAFLVALIAFIVIIVLSVMLVLTVYTRFLKLFIVLPLGTLAFSSFSGDREIAHSSSAYFKYTLGLALEAAAMGLALIVSGLIISSNVFLLGNDPTDLWGSVLYLVQIVLQLAITVGTVRGAHELVSRTLGV